MQARTLAAAWTSLALTATGTPAAAPAPATAVLNLARSEDGTSFADAPALFLRRAAAPDLVRLPDDNLLTVFDYRPPSREADGSVLAVSRSTDQGRSWSPPRSLRFEGLPSKSVRPAHADLVWMPNGRLRAYFQMTEPGGEGRRSGGARSLGSATTRDGLRFQIDRTVRIPMRGTAEAHPTGVWLGSRFELWVTRLARPTDAGDARSRLMRLVSNDGRRFRQARPLTESLFAGNFLESGRGQHRLYGSARGDIISLTADKRGRWAREPQVCLRGGRDPAVIRLEDGTFLMLYTAIQEATSREDAPQLALADGPDDQAGGGENNLPGDTMDDADWSAFDTSGVDPGSAGPDAESTGALPDDEFNAFFAPQPDFLDRIDYVQWLEQNVLTPPEENAYASYEPLFDETGNLLVPRDQFRDMFNDRGDLGPPGPWDPAEHPEWEQSYQATQDLIDQFREASRDPRRFSCPTKFAPGDETDGEATEHLLFEMLLPSLASFRRLAKASIAQSWRTTDDGTVDPDAMRRSWETVLGNANHLQQGATLISNLVGTAEQGIVRDNARWALQQSVFQTPEQIEAALQTLRDYDSPGADSLQWMQAEQASMMDMIQHVFTPDDPDAPPGLNRQRVASLLELAGAEPIDPDSEDIPDMTLDDAQDAIDNINESFRELAEQWQVGYPDVRKADISSMQEERVEHDLISQTLMPNLARAYQLQAYAEASRRATQLTYELHLFQARNGRWPASLDELPDTDGGVSRTDPFTGSDFGYHLGNEGPTLYSRSENGLDDGGIHSPDWDARDSAGDDYVFWPPQND